MLGRSHIGKRRSERTRAQVGPVGFINEDEHVIQPDEVTVAAGRAEFSEREECRTEHGWQKSGHEPSLSFAPKNQTAETNL
ncbi:hypothetical protein GCM10011313_08840 [Mycetocola zhadangensis]|nr:hypothetical protein GCM10011313_08840 [Mycetocola zhadangensis]